MKKWIYLDNAATTPVKQEVFQYMQPYFNEFYGNPSGFSCFSDMSKKSIEKARKNIGEFICAAPNEIYFTSGGTESDNWALKAVANSNRRNGNNIITSKIEHHAILNTCKWLENNGFDVTYIDVDNDGVIKLDELKAAIRPETIMISIMFANNEIGTIQPIKEIGAIAHENNILFHTDAVQAYGHIPINVDEDKIDLLSASSHKIGGPKGCGILYIRNETKIEPFMHGGEQERGLRAETYNTSGIVGFGKATELASETLQQRTNIETKLRDYTIKRILDEIPNCRLNGHRTKRLPNNINISFHDIESETILIKFDQRRICASSGSACTSGSLNPSHVLLAIGLSQETARGALRLTLSENNTKDELDYVVDELKKIVKQLRNFRGAK